MDMVVIMVLIASCFFSVAVNEYSDSVGEGLCSDSDVVDRGRLEWSQVFIVLLRGCSFSVSDGAAVDILNMTDPHSYENHVLMWCFCRIREFPKDKRRTISTKPFLGLSRLMPVVLLDF